MRTKEIKKKTELIDADKNNDSADVATAGAGARATSSVSPLTNNNNKNKMTTMIASPPILALMCCSFTHSYLLISVFPYSGFMAIDLIEKATPENVGQYAGLLAASFSLGRALTAYGWGQLGDQYGRTVILKTSLMASCLCSLLFGLSPTFTTALLARFMLGFVNAIMTIAKTVVSECANGDRDVETRTMALVLGMWGWSFLASPVIAAALSEPTQQYPDVAWLHVPGLVNTVLTEYKFLLPNLFGMLLCLLSTVAVHLYVVETLPRSQQQKHDLWQLPSDCASYLSNQFQRVLRMVRRSFVRVRRRKPKATRTGVMAVGETQPLVSATGQPIIYDGTTTPITANSYNDGVACHHYHYNGIPKEIVVADLKMDIEESILTSLRTGDEVITAELSSAIAGAVRESRIINSIARRSSLVSHERRMSCTTAAVSISVFSDDDHSSTEEDATDEASPETNPQPPATIASIWALQNTRNHLIVYWIASLVMVAIDESFPLFCLATAGGLGLAENSIGKILSASGLIFAVGNYFVYTTIVDRYGLTGSIWVGSLGLAFVALIPISLVLNQTGDDGDTVYEDDGHALTTSAFVFLTIVMALYRMVAMTLFSSITVSTNRTVVPSHRGTLNGLSELGGSAAKAVGPALAGVLVAFSFSSGLFPPQAAAWVIFGVIAFLAVLTTFAARLLLLDAEGEDGIEEHENRSETGTDLEEINV